MALRVTNGIPIPTSSPLIEETAVEGTGLAQAKPPTLGIERSEQNSSAWCYAACAAMAINFCTPPSSPPKLVQQCDIASFVKTTPAEAVDCCNTDDLQCVLTGCKVSEIGLIFDHWHIDFEKTSNPPGSVLGPVPLAKLKEEFAAERPVEVVINWSDQEGSHAVLVTGVDGELVFIIDPLKGNPYGGWRTITSLEDGFGSGEWVKTWSGLRKV